MAPWLIPALKAVLPHIGTIVSVAVPVFTKKKSDGAGEGSLVQDQIAELQAAASQNSAHIRELAETLQGTVLALEQAAEAAQKRLRRVYVYCLATAVLSTVALGTTVILLLSR